MQNFQTCVNIVAPIFITAGLGCFLRARRVTNDRFIKTGTHILFYYILPCSLFMNLYKSDFSSIFNPKLAVFVVAAHVLTMLVCALVMPRFFPNRAQCGIVVQGAFRGNILLLGLPLAMNMYGPAGMGPTALIMAYSIPLYNILGVVTLSVFSEMEADSTIDWGGVLLKIIKNPLVIGTVAALPFALTGVRLPGVVTDTVSGIGGIGSVLGLILLGAQIRFPSIRENRRPIAVAVALKLVVFPAVMMAAAVALGFSRVELGAVFILVSSPMSISSYIMASNMGSEGELAGQMVFVSTAFSIVTLLGGLYALTLLGLL